MKARGFGAWQSAAVLSLSFGCASTTPPPAPTQAPAAAPAPTHIDLASLPRDLVPGPGGAAKPTSTSAPASSACPGEVKPELVSALSSKAAQSRRCYERLLSVKPSARGSYLVNLRVSAKGKVERARLVTDEVGDPAMASCVLSRFRSATYPRPSGGCADVNVPLRYEPHRTAQN